MYNKFKTEFPALACNESFARMIAAGFVMALDPTCEELSEIKTAISEAVTNSVIHGYGCGEGVVILEGELKGSCVTFKITDMGKGIDNIEQARKPLYTGAPDMERSGMGFTIMEAFMDNVEIHSEKGKGTVVILTKNFAEGVTENGS